MLRDKDEIWFDMDIFVSKIIPKFLTVLDGVIALFPICSCTVGMWRSLLSLWRERATNISS